MRDLRTRLIGATSHKGLPGWRVEVRWTAGGVPQRRAAVSGSDGALLLEVPGPDERASGVNYRAITPDGVVVAKSESAPGATWALREPPPAVVTPSDPGVVKRDRLSGRVIDAKGIALPAGTPVALVGVPANAAPASPQVLAQLVTSSGGYFQTDRPQAALASAWGRVNGVDASALPLDPKGQLAPRVVIVAAAAIDGAAEPPCDCGDTPPRTPDPEDLGRFPESFSADLAGRCVDFTVPNRVVEEILFFKVVRATEPDIEGTSPPRPKLNPAALKQLATLIPMVASAAPASAAAPNLSRDIGARLFAHPHELTSATLDRALFDTRVADVQAAVRALAQGSAGRVPMDAAHAVDWDDSPTIYQAVSVAHGHLLQYRQVWRADGYSLGDLLYSLPLAPGQKKLISVLDWSRLDEGVRDEWTSEEEELSAFLQRDRDIVEITDSHLTEQLSGGSNANTWGAGGGVGGAAIGTGWGLFIGVAGGAGGSSSTSWQDSGRNVAVDGMQSIRDGTVQGASVVRSNRSTVIQADHQAERAMASTEVVVNYNHCHALTIEYFEVLRHFTITHELAAVSECLFIPLPMTWFDRKKALRWRETLLRFLRDRALRDAFAATERVEANWVGYDVPEHSFAEEAPVALEGELWISFIIPRPRDDKDGQFQIAEWRWLGQFLGRPGYELWLARLNERAAAERDLVFQKEIAPGIAASLVQRLRFAYVLNDGSVVQVPLDPTLVGQYSESTPLYVTLRPAGTLPNIPRNQIQMVRVSLDGIDFPEDARVLVHRGMLRYDTPHLRHLLFSESRILNDLAAGDDVLVSTPLSPEELRDPRHDDRELAARLASHLNDHLEYYHQMIWMSMDPGRRYMLLDGFQAPNANGRSLASVVENRLMGVVGNCLVMPVSPGNHLAPPFVDEAGQAVPPLEHYAVPPEPPIRVTVPTRGVFAEAVQGACNSCETIDDTRLWKFDESPLPDTPVAPEAPTLDSRAQAPVDTTPTPAPAAIVNIQNPPALPDPLGLASVFGMLAKADLFKDVTGLAANQAAASSAYQAALDTAQKFATYASSAVLQQQAGDNADAMLHRTSQAVKDGLLTPQQAQAITAHALGKLIGDEPKKDDHPANDPTVKKTIDAVGDAQKGSASITTPSGTTVSAAFDGGASDIQVGASPVPASREMERWVRMPIYMDSVTTFDSVADFESTLMPGEADDAKAETWKNIESFGWLRKNPKDATKFDVMVRYRLTIPGTSAASKTPVGKDKVPLVVITHGNHTNFLLGVMRVPPSYRGYADLQDELAKLGIASISVDDNISNWLNLSSEMRARHLLAAIDDLSTRAKTGADGFKDRIDFDRVILIGHSRGGDGVVRAAQLNADATLPGQRCKLSAVCTIAPTDFGGDPNGQQAAIPLSPTETGFFFGIRGTHDADIDGAGGATINNGTSFRHYGRATCPKAHVLIDFANHNRFNTIWIDKSWGGNDEQMSGSPAKPARPAEVAQLIATSTQQALLKEYIGAVARYTLLSDTSAARLLDGRDANSQGASLAIQHEFGKVLPFRVMFGVMAAPGELLVDSFEDPALNDLKEQRVLASGEGVKLFDTKDQLSGTFNVFVYRTQALRVPLDASVTTPATPRLTCQFGVVDASSYTALEFDVAVIGDISSETTTNAIALPKLDLLLTDPAHVSKVLSADVFARPLKKVLWREPITEFGQTFPGVLFNFETVRVPLAKFSGADLTKLSDLQFLADSSSGATVLIDNVRFIREV